MKGVASAAAVEPVEIDDRRQLSNRRKSPRKKILKGGRTYWPNGDSSECIVYNLLETGAHLELRGPAPNTFDLVVDGDGLRRSCCVVWRRANRVGMKFQETARTVAKSSMNRAIKLRQYVEECRTLADHVASSDPELLLEMAEEWKALARRLRGKVR
jgi:hypothetical protein